MPVGDVFSIEIEIGASIKEEKSNESDWLTWKKYTSDMYSNLRRKATELQYIAKEATIV